MSIFERLVRGEITTGEYVADLKRRVRSRRRAKIPGQSCHCWTVEGHVPHQHADWCPAARPSCSLGSERGEGE